MKRNVMLVLLVLCFVVVACGSSPTPTPHTVPNSNPTSSSGSSPSTGLPTALHVTRTDLSATDTLGPLDETITNATAVQKLFQMAQALPAYASQNTISESCISESSLVYHLDFLRQGVELQLMNLDPGSCQVLSLSKTDQRAVSTAFLDYFKQVIQVSSLTWRSPSLSLL